MSDVDYVLVEDVTPLDFERTTIIRCVCYWCHRVYGTKPGHGTTGDSHGICSECCTDCGAPGPFVGSHQLCKRCARIDEQTLIGTAP